MAPPVLDDDDDSDDNDADDETVSEDETGVAKDALLIDERSSDASGSGQQPSVEAPEIATASEGDTNADILKAAFAEGADDDDTPH